MRWVYLEDLIAFRTAVLTGLPGFLGLAAPPHYLDACRALSAPTPTHTRNALAWPPAPLLDVARRPTALAHLGALPCADVPGQGVVRQQRDQVERKSLLRRPMPVQPPCRGQAATSVSLR